jgi:hypothetical protein
MLFENERGLESPGGNQVDAQVVQEDRHVSEDVGEFFRDSRPARLR